MRICWKRVCLLGVITGLFLLVLRGLVIARCAPRSESDAYESPAITVYHHREERIAQMPLEDYIACVVAAEMPISFPLEARKAQAVAARTYTVYHMLHSGCAQHDADVCTSSACCQAYCSDEQMREKWGSDYRKNRESAEQAAQQTARQVLLYDGAPIEALYHSASGGRTENVEDVYSSALPYLRSVMSTAEAGTARLTGREAIDREAFCEKVNDRWPEAKLSPKRLESDVSILETMESGRVKHIRLGKITVTGRQLRGLISLDSALFTVSFTEDEIVFDTKGFGHGVGMSQTGANVMALGGADYREILLYYYTDVTIGTVALK